MCAGSGDRGHAVWANEYFAAMLAVRVPNLEMHIYGNGYHPGSGSTGGLTDRIGTPMGTWQHRFIDWFRDLGFLQKPGVKTKAATDVEAYVSRPPRSGNRRGGQGRSGQGRSDQGRSGQERGDKTRRPRPRRSGEPVRPFPAGPARLCREYRRQ